MLGAVTRDEAGGALGTDIADPSQVGDQRLLVRRGQRMRLGDLDLHPVPPVLDPGADDARPLTLLEVDQGAHEHDRVALVVGHFDHGKASFLARVPRAADRNLGIELAHTTDGIRPPDDNAALSRDWHTSGPGAGSLIPARGTTESELPSRH